MYALERPNMAVNDPRVRSGTAVRRFQMWNTWDIAETENRQHIIDWVANVARGATGGKLKNLVLSCHGAPAYLQLGEGFGSTHIALFAGWRGLIEKIWLPNCSVAFIGSGGSDGNVFCSNLAKQVRCYVVASTETQCEVFANVPYDQMTSFEGLVLCYGPKGNVTWSSRNPSTYDTSTGSCIRVPN